MTDKQDTRSKLIEVAKTIFAEKGYKETSIRSIATAAGANLNAVNYHFENKRNLYLEVIHSSKADLSEKINSLIASDSLNYRDYVVKLYLLFREFAPEFTNNIKIHLDQALSFQEIHENMHKREFCEAGPPGFNSFVEILNNEFGDKISTKGKVWIARSTIIQIFHFAIMFGRKSDEDYAKKHISGDYFIDPEDSITHSAEAVIEYVLRNPNKF